MCIDNAIYTYRCTGISEVSALQREDMLVESKLSELQDEVLRAPLDASRNEMLLLHGTKPEHLQLDEVWDMSYALGMSPPVF